VTSVSPRGVRVAEDGAPLSGFGRPPAAHVFPSPASSLDDAAVSDPVVRLLIDRALAGIRPWLALAIEGGGMAGAVSAGMCVALEALGLIGSFDLIYGSSAGAMNASYTASGQARERSALYLMAAQQGLIDRRRLLLGRPPFRLAEIFTSLFQHHPHAQRVLEDAPRLGVTAARVDDKGLDVLGAFSSLEELRTAVRASAAVPVLAGDVIDFRGRRYVDGGLLESLPYRAALRDGATHVLVLRSRHAEYRKSELRGARRRLVERLLLGAPETVAEMVRERPTRYNDEASDLASPDRAGLGGRVAQFAPPPHARPISQLESRPRRLRQALALGASTVYEALDAAATGHGASVGLRSLTSVSRM
jgi:predicted patatin/cPLA2 family phospholipase